MSVCAQLTTDKLDIDEDAPKPANACVKGLGDLCTLINGLFDDKNVPVHEKVPVWKNYVDAISPGICALIDDFTPLCFTSCIQASPYLSFNAAALGSKNLTSACLAACNACCTTRR
jgi:hypothetical protein